MKKKFSVALVLIILAFLCVIGLREYFNSKAYSVFNEKMDSLKKQDVTVGQARMVDAKTKRNDYFNSVRLSRETARAKAKDGYEKIIKSADYSPESKQQAQSNIVKLNENIVKETDIESLIKSKGFTDAIVFINGDNVTVTLNGEKLTAPRTTQIKDIIFEFVSTKNIKIVEVS